MGWTRRFANLFRQQRLQREFDEELSSHLDEAVEQGRSHQEARRALGGALQLREQSRDIRLLGWLDALGKDVVFGWRQLRKRRTVSMAAVLSLGLALGAATTAFRLVDAVLLRRLPVAHPENLFYLATSYVDHDGRPDYQDEFDYPTFRKYRNLVADRADLILAGVISHDVAIPVGGTETERLYRQFVSGNFFDLLGQQPALGRLLTPNDDRVPGGHPVVVLSYEYWTRRFHRAPDALGKTLRFGSDRFEIVGVAPKGFVGTEPGSMTDVFVPAMMKGDALESPGWTWFRTWVRPKPGFSAEQVRQPLQAAFANEQQEGLKNFHADTPKQILDNFLNQQVLLFPAAYGASGIQKEYRQPLFILAALVGLVLLVACANVGNLLSAQGAARSREMALRVSIGAGKWRLLQLVLVESALLALAASALGMLFAGWSAPLVVSMLHVPGDPVRLVLDPGWQDLAFSAALALAVTAIFGLAPALRASAVKPMSALKGAVDVYSRRRLTNGLLAAQMAFCVLVLFVAGLFVSTFERLSHRPLGFSPKNVMILDTSSAGSAQPLASWMQAADHLRQTPGVESVSLAGWALLTGNAWSWLMRVPGRAEAETVSPYLLGVSPGFFETMRIARLDGRDFRPGDLPPRLQKQGPSLSGSGIVNESFARVYFDGQNPVGRSVLVLLRNKVPTPLEIVGLVRDASYKNLRESVHPTIYLPLDSEQHASFLVRTSGDAGPLASVLRQEVSRARSDFRVRTVEMQTDYVRWHLVRERLLAMLSLFFAITALVLAAIGLYGVLNYSVTRHRREIGIRMALGASSASVVRRVTVGMLGVVCLGAVIGLAGGLASGRFVQTLLFDVKPGDASTMAAPILALLAAALLAAVPPAMRAVRIDPVETLRSE